MQRFVLFLFCFIVVSGCSQRVHEVVKDQEAEFTIRTRNETWKLRIRCSDKGGAIAMKIENTGDQEFSFYASDVYFEDAEGVRIGQLGREGMVTMENWERRGAVPVGIGSYVEFVVDYPQGTKSILVERGDPLFRVRL